MTFIVGDIKQRNEGIFVKGRIGDVKTTILVDTGSSLTIVNPTLFNEINPDNKIKLTKTNVRLRTAKGDDIPVLGECLLSIMLESKEFSHNCIIAQIENRCILGVDFMSKFSCNICMKEQVIRIQGIDIPYFCDRFATVDESRVILSEDIIIPPSCEFIAPGRIESPIFQKGIALVEPLDKFMEKQDILISKTLVKTDEGIIPLKYLNLKTESLKLYKGSVVATIEKVDETENTSESVCTVTTCNMSDKNETPEHLKQIIDRVHESVSIEEKQILANLLT
jgi:predicted aspartyl protease